MKKEVFFCHFEPISDYQWILKVGQQINKEYLWVQISIFDDDLLRRDFPEAPPIAIDLIELAIIVYAVDRSIQPVRNSYCSVHVTVPVRSPDKLMEESVHIQLAEILHWYTGYEWIFQFEKRSVSRRETEIPQMFDWRELDKPVDVALWSGGLDCLAGLYNRAIENDDREFVLCGTGNNSRIHALQKRVISLLPQRIAQRVKLSQIRYGIKCISGQLPKSPRLRSRGFTFMLIGAICAHLEGRNVLQVYENGIGAINLRFRESEIGVNHAHSVHPLSLMLIGQWLTHVLGKSVRIENPYLFWTKAQMCEVFLKQDALSIAFTTQTCDRMHRKPDAKQCGRCSSCILRRHAFAALDIHDQTSYVYDAEDWLYEPVGFKQIDRGNHIPAVLHQINQFEHHLTIKNSWQSFATQYETLSAHVVDRTAEYSGIDASVMRDKLLELFRRYVEEWYMLRRLSR